MSCSASSFAAFIVGAIGGGALMLLVSAMTMATVYKEFASKNLRRLRRIESGAWKLYRDNRVEGLIAEDAPDDSPATTYEVPADAWEQFEAAIELDDEG